MNESNPEARVVAHSDTNNGETGAARSVSVCPVCGDDCAHYSVSFSKEGTWCNHKGWVLRTGLTRDDPPILGGVR